MIVPLFYCILWFGVWGGAGLRQQRQAVELQHLGETHFNDTNYFVDPDNSFCFDVPQEDVVVNGTTIFTNYWPGITPVCTLDSANQETAAFNVLYSFSFPDDFSTGYGPVLTGLFIISLSVYFATSSDSGSLIVDFLAANGKLEHHWLQRLFWALTEGAVATALLNAGGSDGLSALQAAAIICGFPFTIMLMYILQSIYEMCDQALDEDRDYFEFNRGKNQFEMPVYGGIFNVFELLASAGSVHPSRAEKGMGAPSGAEISEFFQGLFVPFFSVFRITMNMFPEATVSNILITLIFTSVHIGWILMFAMTGSRRGFLNLGWTLYVVNGVILTSLKVHYRSTRDVHGNVLGDFISSLVLWPQVVAQINIGLDSEAASASGSGEGEVEAGAEEIVPNYDEGEA